MGGGRRNLQPREVRDIEEGRKGYRRDGKDLIKEWEEDKKRRGLSHSYLWNKDDLLAANLSDTDYLLGRQQMMDIMKQLFSADSA